MQPAPEAQAPAFIRSFYKQAASRSMFKRRERRRGFGGLPLEFHLLAFEPRQLLGVGPLLFGMGSLLRLELSNSIFKFSC
jgi:hypothetical protein